MYERRDCQLILPFVRAKYEGCRVDNSANGFASSLRETNIQRLAVYTNVGTKHEGPSFDRPMSYIDMEWTQCSSLLYLLPSLFGAHSVMEALAKFTAAIVWEKQEFNFKEMCTFFRYRGCTLMLWNLTVTGGYGPYGHYGPYFWMGLGEQRWPLHRIIRTH